MILHTLTAKKSFVGMTIFCAAIMLRNEVTAIVAECELGLGFFHSNTNLLIRIF
jgi:hypothetical protein